MKAIRITLLLFATIAPIGILTAQVRVEALVWQANDQLVINFSDDGTGVAGDFSVQKSGDLSAGGWTNYANVTIESRPGGGWRAIVLAPEDEPRAFFRIAKGGEVVTAVFELQTAQVREGSGAGVIVQFSAPFSGTLNYTIDSGSGPVPGQVNGDGSSSVVIPLAALADDAVADELGYLSLRLLGGPGYDTNGYGMTILVEDNDALWGGVLDSDQDDVDVAVRLLTIEQDGTQTACIKTDGAGLLPANTNGNGDWLFSSFTLTDTEFTGTVGPITIPAAETIYGQPTNVTLTFDSTNGGNVSEGKLEGSFTLTTTVPDLPHLTFPERTGTFVFIREATTPGDLEAPVAAP